MAIKYKWLAGILREQLQRNVQNGIHKLPSEQTLCETYHVSRQTVREALALLKDQHLIETRRGSGSYATGLSSEEWRNQIGIFISSSNEYIYPGVLEDIRQTLLLHGFSSIVFETHNQIRTERDLLLSLMKSPPRGLIVEGCLTSLPNPNVDLYEKLSTLGTSIVFLYNYYPQLTNCLYVKDDNYSGSAQLVKHLYEQGHTKIAGIFKSDDMQGIERYQGYIETLRDLSLSISDQRIGWFDASDLRNLESNQDTLFLRHIVQDRLRDCDSVICYNDEIAYWLVKELLLAGYKLPQDISITAFDNTYLSNQGILTLTTLAHKPHEMGQTAANMIVNKLKGLPVRRQQVPWSLTIKESSSQRDF